MINDVDEALRQLLIRELPVKNGEINIEFDQPKRDWSSRLSRPTLNIFLYDVRENKSLRQQEWQVEKNGTATATKRRTPVRVDLHYMITAWAAEPEDEHRLLARTLMALFRFAMLPDEVLPASLKVQPVPIPLWIGQAEELPKPSDIWGVLENELRPTIPCLITVSLNPYQPVSGPLVRTRDLQFHVTQEPDHPEQFFMVGGMLRGNRPDGESQVKLVERGQDVPVGADGRFVLGNLATGTYTLEFLVDGKEQSRYSIRVPSDTYDIDLTGGDPAKPLTAAKRSK